ncbi:hypothetical protein KGF57_002098 [Candida theae]|uniref:EamA domain-containing protein n=1 Tax=Candida theae TaxID=1198502 RepID=A0AAD5FZC0_9ASCO|nr:uncharacterized protein KGF57_002098 [Candida theae]KAI5959460.1 hypothetical protein KGF57_002098 [Candida theae]
MLLPQRTSDPEQVVDFITQEEKRKYKAGIILLVISIVAWIVGLELVNGVLKSDEYRKPIFFAVITGSCFSFNLLYDLLELTRKPVSDENKPLLIADKQEEQESSILSAKEVLIIAFQIATIYLFYNIFVMESLRFTSASNQTVIGSLTSVFTLLIGVLIKTERFSKIKVICVAVSCCGVFLVNLSSVGDQNGEHKYTPKNPKLGNILALGGALFYAFYLLIMKFKCGGAKTTNERRLFGFVGVMIFLMGVPVLYIADIMDVEKFELPSNNTILFIVVLNGVLTVVSDYTSILAMLLTSPLVVSLTLTSSIPITIFIDYVVLIYTKEPINTSSVYILGILCIFVAVLLVNVNVASENTLIEEIIEDSLESAIHNDELMSPILSPLLEEGSSHQHQHRRHHHLQHPIKSPFQMIFSPEMSTDHEIPIPARDVTTFNLNENDESPPTRNLNHDPSIYTSKPDAPTLHVSSGKNHTYDIHLE